MKKKSKQATMFSKHNALCQTNAKKYNSYA